VRVENVHARVLRVRENTRVQLQMHTDNPSYR